MKLSKLLEIYGDDNYKFQNLDADIKQMNKRKNHYEYSFGTQEPFSFNGTSKIGLVIWLDRDKMKKILSEDNGK